MRIGLQVLTALIVLNLGTYAFQLAAGQLLGPSGFGELAALLALLNLIGLPLGAVQIAVARHVAELRAADRPGDAGAIARAFLVAAAGGSLILMAVYAALLLPLDNVLGLSSVGPLALMGLAIPAAVALPVMLGLLQGEQRFREYSVALASTGALRPGIFGLAYFYGYRLSGAVAAIVLAAFAGCVLAARRSLEVLRAGGPVRAVLGGPARALVPIAAGFLAITALTNIDLLFAKASLSDEEAGIFGAGALVGRAILYLPTAMFAVMLPRVAARRVAGSDTRDILGRTVLLLAVLCVLFTATLFLFPRPILSLAFGDDYLAGAGELGLFGLAASLFSLLNLYVNYDLSRGERRLAYELTVLAALQIVALAIFHGDIRTILVVDIAVGAIGLAYYEARHQGTRPALEAAALRWRAGAAAPGEPPASLGVALRRSLASTSRSAARGGAVVWRRSRFAAAITGLYGAIVVLATWPVAANMNGSYFGFGNDNLGGIWNFWWWSYAAEHGLDPDRSPFLGAPFGYDLSGVPVQPYERWMGQWLTTLFGEVAAYNLIILVSFPLAGLTMYLLANYLLRNRLAASFAGLLFAFAPFHFGMAMNYPALSSVQFVPLYALFLARALFERRPRDVIGAILSFGLVAVGSYYYAYYGLWVTLVVLVVFGIRERRGIAAAFRATRTRIQSVRGAVTAGVTGLAALAVLAFLVSKPLGLYLENRDSLERPLSEAVRYSTRPLLWLTPGVDHPVFGEHLRPFYDGHLHDAPFNEQSMYLGVMPLLLAIVGAVAAIRGARIRRAVGFALVVGGTGALIALGPFLPLATDYYARWPEEGGGAKLPLPGRLMFELAPSFRFFSRAQVFVILGLALAAAAGVLWLMKRFPGRRAGVLVVVIAAVIGFEWSDRPPARVVEIGPTPAVYEWLADQPGDFMVAEYPMTGPAAPRTLYYQFWAREHRKRLVNVPGSPESVALFGAVNDIADPGTAGVLADLGVRYAVVHTKLPPATYPPYQPVLPDDSLPRGYVTGYPGLHLVKRLPDAEVYRVVKARPAARGGRLAGPAVAGAGFYPPEGAPGRTFRWMGTAAEITFRPLGTGGERVRLEAVMQSFAQPRTVRVEVDGQPVGALRVTTQARAVSVPFRLGAGDSSTIRLIASPPGRSPAEVLGSPDGRELAINVRDARVVPDG
jgi:O-antigen/teichoic acid export membrane protein